MSYKALNCAVNFNYAFFLIMVRFDCALKFLIVWQVKKSLICYSAEVFILYRDALELVKIMLEHISTQITIPLFLMI